MIELNCPSATSPSGIFLCYEDQAKDAFFYLRKNSKKNTDNLLLFFFRLVFGRLTQLWNLTPKLFYFIIIILVYIFPKPLYVYIKHNFRISFTIFFYDST